MESKRRGSGYRKLISMKTEIYESLKKLHDKHKPQEFGKICQKFIAIAFKMEGYTHIVERGVQGVDVDAAGKDGEKYTVEVKTTLYNEVIYGKKDHEGLQKRKEDGYLPVLAVLRLNRLSDWIFAKAGKLNPGKINIDILKIYRINELEETITPSFDEAVMEHFEGTMNEGQSYLDNCLRQ